MTITNTTFTHNATNYNAVRFNDGLVEIYLVKNGLELFVNYVDYVDFELATAAHDAMAPRCSVHRDRPCHHPLGSSDECNYTYYCMHHLRWV